MGVVKTTAAAATRKYTFSYDTFSELFRVRYTMVLMCGMAFDSKKIILTGCLTVAIIVGVLYAYTRYERPQHDAENADAELGTFVDPSLKSVTVLFRHGDRAPSLDYKTFPNIYEYDFPEGKGQLTKLGKQHMYQKGKLLRRLYNGFISDLYLDGEISIKTTKLSRTFMSAAMVLAGMYPPKDYQKWSDLETVWQPIPISSDSPDRTTCFRSVKCPYISLFLKKDEEKIINNDDKNQIKELLIYMSEKCGIPINIKELFHLYDLFVSSISNGIQLPEWIRPKHYQLIESAFNQQTRRIFGDKKIQAIIAGSLLKEISLNIALQLNNSTTLNNTRNIMHLYAGHDLSIGMILYFLGNNNIKMPDFGASIHFHLHLDKTLGYIVKVFYYNKWDVEQGEEMSTSVCGNPCKLEDFIKVINENFSTEWKKECQIVEN